jgi:hypothetical protein
MRWRRCTVGPAADERRVVLRTLIYPQDELQVRSHRRRLRQMVWKRPATRQEAEANVRDLMMRWFAVRETRVVESDDPVNYRYFDGRLKSLGPEESTPATMNKL